MLAIATVGAANAQKNTILVLGNVGINTDNTDYGSKASTLSRNSTSWNVNPGVGYQFSNHFTLGLQGGYMANKTSTKDKWTPAPPSSFTTDTKWREWQVGVFGRYTMPLGGIFSMWTQLDLSYVSGKETYDSVGVLPSGAPRAFEKSDEYNGFQAMLVPALAINVYHGLALNFGIGGIGYRTISYDKAPTTQNGFMFTFGQQVNVGISKNFGCRKHHGHGEPGMENRKMKKKAASDDDDE